MTDDQRNAYENLVLVCPNHHNLVDDLEHDRYPVEMLTDMRYRSEAHLASWWASEGHLEEAFGRSAVAVMRERPWA